MTTQTQTRQTLQFNVTKHGWKDAFVVSFLALVLGAFVAQISTVPTHTSRTVPVASASSSAASQG
jgi:hypothetical protein